VDDINKGHVMAKKQKGGSKSPVVEKEWKYLRKSVFLFEGGQWTVDGVDIKKLPSQSASYFFAHALSGRSPFEFYNVEYCSDRVIKCSTYENLDIIRSWVDMLVEMTSCALYQDIYKHTEGEDRVKYKASDLANVEFSKYFQGN
jgi:hypothetical protein